MLALPSNKNLLALEQKKLSLTNKRRKGSTAQRGLPATNTAEPLLLYLGFLSVQMDFGSLEYTEYNGLL